MTNFERDGDVNARYFLPTFYASRKEFELVRNIAREWPLSFETYWVLWKLLFRLHITAIVELEKA